MGGDHHITEPRRFLSAYAYIIIFAAPSKATRSLVTARTGIFIIVPENEPFGAEELAEAARGEERLHARDHAAREIDAAARHHRQRVISGDHAHALEEEVERARANEVALRRVLGDPFRGDAVLGLAWRVGRRVLHVREDVREPHARHDVFGGHAPARPVHRLPEIGLLQRRRREARMPALSRHLAKPRLGRHEIRDAEPRAHAHHDARLVGRGLARLDRHHVARREPLDAVGGRGEVVHDAHLRNEEAARDRVAVHDERTMGHLHLVAQARPGHTQTRRIDALALTAHNVPLAEERGEHV